MLSTTALAAISYDPIVHVKIGPLNISPHGVGIAVGFLAGAFLMLPAARRRGIDDDTVFSLLTRAAVGSIIGARLAYVINHASDYESPLEVLQVWKGGISLLGGFTGAILLAIPHMRSRGLSFWKVMDAAAPGMALGVIIGRLGDLVVGDHLGKPTTFALGYLCPPGVVVHHTALYDLAMTAVLLAVLLLVRRKPRFDGFLILLFAVIYGAQRLIEDFLREDVRRFGLTGSQWTATITGLLCLYVLVIRRRTPWWGRWDERDGQPSVDAAALEEAVEEEHDKVDAAAEAEVVATGAAAAVATETTATPAPASQDVGPTSTTGDADEAAGGSAPADTPDASLVAAPDDAVPADEVVNAAPDEPTRIEPDARTEDPVAAASDAVSGEEPPEDPPRMAGAVKPAPGDE